MSGWQQKYIREHHRDDDEQQEKRFKKRLKDICHDEKHKFHFPKRRFQLDDEKQRSF